MTDHEEIDPSQTSLVLGRRSAEVGSEELYQALHLQFLNFAIKHRISLNDAKLLLMNSVSPRRAR